MSVALVTGASKGFGLATVRGLVMAGWQVACDARDANALQAALSDVSPEQLALVPGDVTEARHRDRLIQAARIFGPVGLLINNASTLGAAPLPPLATYPLATLADAFATNVVAPLALAQLVRDDLVVTRGTIVNISSDAAVEAYEGWGGYGASKAALDQVSAVLGAENPDLRIYSFDPGDMRTDMHQAAFPGEDISDRPAPETVVPALLRLIEQRPASGRYRAVDLVPRTEAGVAAR